MTPRSVTSLEPFESWKVYHTHRVDRGGECVEVNNHVYFSRRERRHAAGVAPIGVDVVHADGIRTQLGHGGGIALALRRVDQRVVLRQLICNAWSLLAT